jgi:hypothetical protein
LGIRGTKKFQKIEEIHEIPRESLSEEEIIRAYEKLNLRKQNQKTEDKRDVNMEYNGSLRDKEMPENMKDKYQEFLKWMEKEEQEKKKDKLIEIPKPEQTDRAKVNYPDSKDTVTISVNAKNEHENSIFKDQLLEKENRIELQKPEQNGPTAKVNYAENSDKVTETISLEAKNEHENSNLDIKDQPLEKENLITDFEDFKDPISVSSDDDLEFEEAGNLEDFEEQPVVIGGAVEPLVELSVEPIIEVEVEPIKEPLIEPLTVTKIEPLIESLVEKVPDDPVKIQNGQDPSASIPIVPAAQTITPGQESLKIQETPKVTEIEPQKLKAQSPKLPPKLKKAPQTDLEQEQDIIKSIKGSLENIEKIMVEAKITLSDAPLKVESSITNLNLGGSTLSLASNRSRERSADSTRKRASHSKGRAPEPPALSLSQPKEATSPTPTPQFYHPTTQKFFKETEL